MNYYNYHKHTHVSSIFTPDSNEHAEGYIKEIAERGGGSYCTLEHGTMGDIFEAKTICKKYGVRCLPGIEGYIVPNPLEKDKSNYHIVILPRTDSARKKVNMISSRANIEGYYYKPRIFPEDLLRLQKDDVFITTACVAGLLRDEASITGLFYPLYEHFGENVFLEVQTHDAEVQKTINKKALALADEFGLRIVAANDSHYVKPEGRYERLELLKGKHIDYGDEDAFILDFPTAETMVERFKKQGVLSDAQINTAISNTLLLEECEEIDIDYSIKMPTIYPDLSLNERVDLLKSEVKKRFDVIRRDENIVGEELDKYEAGIAAEMQTIVDTNDEIHTADYFLFNEKNVDLATNKYGGVLTRGGRGSCGSFYINRILGMTQLDRFRINLPLFPERFMSTARLLENRALPDIDYNVKDQEPFVKASRELLGEHGCYPMIAYGTMQLGEAFRNVCRSKGLEFEEFNDVAKNIEEYFNDLKWRPLIDEAQKYVGTIVSASVHPCAHILSNEDLRSEYGVIRLGDFLCVMITSAEADEYKVLKNDYLVVKVWKLIDETFKEVGIPIPPAKEILESIKDDNRIWDLFKNGITTTLNQVDSNNGSAQAKRYGISSFEEGAFIAAAIRPSFDSWRELFLSKKPYSTGSKELDEVLSMTDHFILFQENLMQYFDWLGVSPAESIGLIKKISKKKIHQEDFDNLEERLRKNWIKQTGSDRKFDDTWKLVQSCISYGFCSAHAAATSLDMCYGAYCKVHYPYEYYSVCFNNYVGDEERTAKLKEELKYFGITLKGIEFRHSNSRYSYDKKAHIIYKGMESIKFMNAQVADEIYALRNNNYCSFTDLLYDLNEKTSIDSRQLDILIKLDFFREFGSISKLEGATVWFDQLHDVKVLSLDKVEALGLDREVVRMFSDKSTATRLEEFDVERWAADTGNDVSDCVKPRGGYSTKRTIKKFGLDPKDLLPYATKIVIGRFSEIHNRELLRYLEEHSMAPETSVENIVRYQREYLGYIDYVDPQLDKRTVVVTNLDTKYAPKFTAYCLATGQTCEMRIHRRKDRRKGVVVSWGDIPLCEGDIIYMTKCKQEPRVKKVNDNWQEIPGEYQWWLNDYKKVDLTK